VINFEQIVRNAVTPIPMHDTMIVAFDALITLVAPRYTRTASMPVWIPPVIPEIRV
jgi:hypothetical protein